MADSGTGTLLLPLGRKVKIYQKKFSSWAKFNCYHFEDFILNLLYPMVYRKRTFPIFPAVGSCHPTGHGENRTLYISLKCLRTSSIREKPPGSAAEVDKEITWKKSAFHSHFCQFLCLGFFSQL